MNNEKESKVLIYVPSEARTNIDNKPMSPPETEYEERKVELDKNAVKDVTKGKYGSDEQGKNTGL